MVSPIPWFRSFGCAAITTSFIREWQEATSSNSNIHATWVSLDDLIGILWNNTLMILLKQLVSNENNHLFSNRSLLQVLLLSFLGMVFGLLTKFSFGRKLLLDYPKLFSLGFFSHEGPTEETMKNTKFSITFFGQGWPKEESLPEPSDQHTTLPSKKLVTRVTASNPGEMITNSNSALAIDWLK